MLGRGSRDRNVLRSGGARRCTCRCTDESYGRRCKPGKDPPAAFLSARTVSREAVSLASLAEFDSAAE